jgi:hypothetical protein
MGVISAEEKKAAGRRDSRLLVSVLEIQAIVAGVESCFRPATVSLISSIGAII